MLRVAWIGCLALATAMTGCGDDDRGGGGGGNPPTIEAFLPEFADATCDALDSCFGPLASAFVGDEDCASVFARQFEQAAGANLRMWVESGRVIYDASAAGDCLAAIRAGGCDALDTAATAMVCEDAVEGTVPLGDSCSDGAECVGSAFCDRAGLSCPGTCTARGAMGAGCSDDDHCEAALYCSSADTCATPAATGEACEGGVAPDCDDGLFCTGADDEAMTAGTCRVIDDVFTQAEGASCDLDAGMLCQEGLSCSVDMIGAGGVTFVCAGPAAAGAACTFGIPDPCPVGEYCNADVMMLMPMGTCTRKPGDGEACIEGFTALAAGGPCGAGTACVDGTCLTRVDNGMACMGDGQCYSGNCNSGTCASIPVCM